MTNNDVLNKEGIPSKYILLRERMRLRWLGHVRKQMTVVSLKPSSTVKWQKGSDKPRDGNFVIRMCEKGS